MRTVKAAKKGPPTFYHDGTYTRHLWTIAEQLFFDREWKALFRWRDNMMWFPCWSLWILLSEETLFLSFKLARTVTGGHRQSHDEAQWFIMQTMAHKTNSLPLLTAFSPHCSVMPADKHVLVFLPNQKFELLMCRSSSYQFTTVSHNSSKLAPQDSPLKRENEGK